MLAATLGASTLTTSTTYDAAGRPNAVIDPLGRRYDVGYDAASRRTSLAYPNAVQTIYAYDARDRLANLSSSAHSSAYILDAAGRRTQSVDGDGTVRRYGYDAVDRLTSEAVTGALSYAKAFTYDAVGNRKTQVTNGSGQASSSYDYDARDRLIAETGATYTYDANGNTLTKSGEAAYAWDVDNRLTRVVMSDGRVVSHGYDADGNRVATTASMGATTMLVDTAGGLSHVVVETAGSGAFAAVYVRLGDELLSVLRPDGHGGYSTRWVHGDGIGSVRALTDESGTTTDTRTYDAFGTKKASAGSDTLAYEFAGEPRDAVSDSLTTARGGWIRGGPVSRDGHVPRKPGTPRASNA